MAKLLAVLQEQVGQTPSHADIESWSQLSEATTDPAEDMDKKVGHCFSIFNSEIRVIAISNKLSFQADWCSVLFLVCVCVFVSQKSPICSPCSSLS